MGRSEGGAPNTTLLRGYTIIIVVVMLSADDSITAAAAAAKIDRLIIERGVSYLILTHH